ncbi:unnamed protein product [Cunninghamella blakesleeana]
MGLLTSFATSYSWEETQKYTGIIKTHGLNQFLNAYYNKMDQKQSFVWGDEIEYSVVKLDKKNKSAKLSLRAFDLLSKLQKAESDYEIGLRSEAPESLWRLEGGRQMLESTPGVPYNATLKDLVKVEGNMKRRRKLAKEVCHPDDYPITLVTYPRLGCPDELYPEYDTNGPLMESIFLPDQMIDHTIRFISLNSNIKGKRGAKVAINIPIYRDLKIRDSFMDPSLSLYKEDNNKKMHQVALPDHIYMDSIVFGGSCCCLQVTLQACDINEARAIYDQLAPMAPIMLALTAATPIFRGYLVDTDTRWEVLAQSLDDRSEIERSTESSNPSEIKKERRYGPINTYISNDNKYKSKYNDLNISYDKDTYQQLLKKGVDESLAKHISHIFTFDSLTIPTKLMAQGDDENSIDHFDNIQSACYQSVRFKLPPPNSGIGWRVEFRSMEVQLTDFENAAFSTFIILLARTIKHFDLNFYIPMSKVHENINTALKRGAVRNDKFYFRKNVYKYAYHERKHEDDYELMTIDTIFNGQSNENDFSGLIPLIKSYLNETNVDDTTKQVLFNYLNFISKRASGELMTIANYLRAFVRQHPDYKYDSVITSSINYDIVKLANDINQGSLKIPELHGDFFL